MKKLSCKFNKYMKMALIINQDQKKKPHAARRQTRGQPVVNT